MASVLPPRSHFIWKYRECLFSTGIKILLVSEFPLLVSCWTVSVKLPECSTCEAEP